MTSTTKTFSVVRQAVSYVRTLDHLRAWPLRLPHDIKEVVLTVDTSNDTQHTGTKLFAQQSIPQLKFANPSVKFSVESGDSQRSEITFVSEDGDRQVMETTGLHWRDIQGQLNSLFNSPPPPPLSHPQ